MTYASDVEFVALVAFAFFAIVALLVLMDDSD